MKIKLHKKLRSVLSVLVAFMILVGVMPTAVWNGIKADAVTLSDGDTIRLYFCPDPIGYSTQFSCTDGYIYVYGKVNNSTTTSNLVFGTYVSGGQTKQGPTKMNYLLGSAEMFRGEGSAHTKHRIYYYDITAPANTTWNIEAVIFTNSGDSYGWSGGQQTSNITANISDGMLFYINGGSGKAFTCGNFEFVNHPYVVSADRIMNKDTNIPSGDGFTKNDSGNREYYSATFYDYFSDYELRNNLSRKTKTSYTTEEDVHLTGLRSYGYHADSGIKNIPTFTLNDELSSYYRANSTNIKYPIYFGNFKEEDITNQYYKFTELNNSGLNEGLTNSSPATVPWLWYASSVTTIEGYQKFYYGNNSVARTDNSDVVFTGNSAVAAQGLYADKLANDSSGNNKVGYLQLSSNTTTTVRAPFFNSSWLESNSVGASYSVEIPFFKVQTANGDYWELDSSKESEALRMKRYVESGVTKYYYLEETGKGVSGVSNYTPSSDSQKKKSGYDFLPFNSASDFSGLSNRYYFDQVNYNFGFDLTIPFTLTDDGTVTGNNGTPITFEFSGDDDLVVYLDGDLVLDIGGDHSAVTGSIDFSTLTSTVSRVKNPNNTTDETNKPFNLIDVLDKNDDGDIDDNYVDSEDGKTYSEDIRGDNKTHYLKVFCMERGLFESNVKIKHNLPTIAKRSFKVDTYVSMNNLDDVFKNNSTIETNLEMVDFDIDVQFSKANDANTYDFVTFGDTPEVYNNNIDFIKDNNTKTYSFVQQDAKNSMLYKNDFIKNSEYYLKVSEKSNYQLKFTGTNSSTNITEKKIGDLFDCGWTLKLKSADDYSGQSGQSTISNNSFGPVHTTSASSRPAQAIKTTSTSANASDSWSYFDFSGTVDEPDEIVFTNSLSSGTLSITKNFANGNSNLEEESYDFYVTVTFDKVGGEGIELEEERDAATGAFVNANAEDRTEIITKSHTFTLTTLNSFSETLDIVVPLNTVVTITESGATPTYTVAGSSGETVNGSTVTFTMTASTTVTMGNPTPSIPQTPQPIILKIQKVWENTNTLPENIKFKVEKSDDNEEHWSNVTGIVVDANGDTISDVTFTDGELTLNSNCQTTLPSPDGRTAWVVYIYDSSNHSDSQYIYRVTEYNGNNELGDGGQLPTSTVTFKVKYSDDTGLINKGSYGGIEQQGLTNPSGDSTDYGDRVLTLSVINRAFIKIRVQSYFTQTDEAQQNGLPTGGVKLSVQRKGVGSSGWEPVVDSIGTQVQNITITEHSADNAPTPRQFYSYVLPGEYDPDYDYRVLEYADDGTTLIENTSSQSFSTVFDTVSYNGGGIKKGVHLIADGLDQENGSYVILTDSNSHSGYGITMAILNSASGTIGGADTGGLGGYLPIAGGFVAVLLAGAFFFIYKKRFLV